MKKNPSIWEKQRDHYLSTHNHTDITHIAEQYLSKFSDNIRFIFGCGKGSGEFISGINIIQHLFSSLNYRGAVEIIAPMQGSLDSKMPSPLQTIMQLYNVEHLFKRDVLKTTLPDGLEIHFYDLAYYKKYLKKFPEVELAIFPGMLSLTRRCFYSWPEYLSGNAYNFEYKLTTVAKSKRAIYFNPFSWVIADSMNYGFITQLKNQQPRKNFPSLSLSYPIHLPSPALITDEIKRILLKERILGENLQQLLAAHRQERDITFSIYGIHHLDQPEYSLLNMIYAAQDYAAKLDNTKTLKIFLFSKVSDESWNNLHQIFQKNLDSLYLKNVGKTPQKTAKGIHEKTIKEEILQALATLKKEIIFFDNIHNQTLLQLNFSHIAVIRMPYLPWALFTTLYNSTIAPVYEGANTADLLENLPRWGLACPKTEGRFRSIITDFFKLPEELKEAGNLICTLPSLGFNELWQNTTPAEKIGSFMKLCSQLERRALLPAENRISAAITDISEQKHCHELNTTNAEFNLCQLQEIWQHPAATLYFVRIAASMTTKGLIYGTLEKFLQKFLENRGAKKHFALQTARFSQLLVRGMQEGDWADSGLTSENFFDRNFNRGDFLVMGVWIIELLLLAFSAVSDDFNHPYLNQFLNSLMTLIILLPQINNDFSTSYTIFLPLVLLFFVSFNLGERVGETSYKFVSDKFAAFFSPQMTASRTELSTATKFSSTIPIKLE